MEHSQTAWRPDTDFTPTKRSKTVCLAVGIISSQPQSCAFHDQPPWGILKSLVAPSNTGFRSISLNSSLNSVRSPTVLSARKLFFNGMIIAVELSFSAEVELPVQG
jgi:hypothetical protein